jgi:hypothetical protein
VFVNGVSSRSPKGGQFDYPPTSFTEFGNLMPIKHSTDIPRSLVAVGKGVGRRSNISGCAYAPVVRSADGREVPVCSQG